MNFPVGILQQDSVQRMGSGDSVFSAIPGGTLQLSDTLMADSSILEKAENKTFSPSILHKRQQKPTRIEPQDLPYGNEDWITVHFLLALVVYSWVRLFYSKRLKQVFRALSGIRFQGMLAREGNLLRERISIALMIVYLISTTLLVYLVFTRILHFKVLGLDSFRLFSFIMLLVIVFWILKNLANSIIGRVFKNPVVISEYLLTNFVFNITIGSLLIPVLILAVYLPSVEMLYFALGIWVIGFIYRLIRLMVTSLSYTKFSLFNRFLYLCTFELTPVFIIIKLVMSNLDQ